MSMRPRTAPAGKARHHHQSPSNVHSRYSQYSHMPASSHHEQQRSHPHHTHSSFQTAYYHPTPYYTGAGYNPYEGGGDLYNMGGQPSFQDVGMPLWQQQCTHPNPFVSTGSAYDASGYYHPNPHYTGGQFYNPLAWGDTGTRTVDYMSAAAGAALVGSTAGVAARMMQKSLSEHEGTKRV